MQQEAHPGRFTVDYPDRPLDRLTTGFRLVVANRVIAYALVLVTDRYPPFRLTQ